jgi:hypothetical protein
LAIGFVVLGYYMISMYYMINICCTVRILLGMQFYDVRILMINVSGMFMILLGNRSWNVRILHDR